MRDDLELNEPLLRSPRRIGRSRGAVWARLVCLGPALVGVVVVVVLLWPRRTVLPPLDAITELVTFGDSYSSTYGPFDCRVDAD